MLPQRQINDRTMGSAEVPFVQCVYIVYRSYNQYVQLNAMSFFVLVGK